MALYCLVSPGGSPGVTATALGLALSWPREVVIAECDPAGGSVLAGFLVERLQGPPGPGLLGLAMEASRDPGQGTARLGDLTIPLTGDGRGRLLHGISDPRQADLLAPLWPSLARIFTAAGTDVIADLGRVGGPDTPFGLVTGADLVVMVLHRSLVHIDAARPRLHALRAVVGDQVPVGLCLIDSGAYSAAAVRDALEGVPVLAELPYARSDAAVLSDGTRPHLGFPACLLMRAVGRLGQRMRKTVEERAFHPSGPAAAPLGGGGR